MVFNSRKVLQKIYETVIPHAFGFVRGSAILLLSYELYRRKKFKVWRLKYVPGAKGPHILHQRLGYIA